MLWLVICGGILLLGLSYGAGQAIVGDDAVWLTLLVGFVSIVCTVAVLGGFIYGLHEVLK